VTVEKSGAGGARGEDTRGASSRHPNSAAFAGSANCYVAVRGRGWRSPMPVAVQGGGGGEAVDLLLSMSLSARQSTRVQPLFLPLRLLGGAIRVTASRDEDAVGGRDEGPRGRQTARVKALRGLRGS
jgi:hypothetical protein